MNFITKYLLASILLLFVVSCSDDDSDNGASDQQQGISISESDLAGTWQLSGFSINNGNSVTEANGQRIEIDFTSFGENFDYVAVFDTMPNRVSGSGTYDVVTTTSFSGQESTETTNVDSNNFDSDLLSGDWKLSEDGKKIITTENGIVTSESLIIEFSENRLVYSIDLSAAEPVESSQTGDFSIKTTGNTIVTLTR